MARERARVSGLQTRFSADNRNALGGADFISTVGRFLVEA